MLSTGYGPAPAEPLAADVAALMVKLHDRTRLRPAGLVAARGLLTLRQCCTLRDLGLIEVVNGGSGDMVYFTRAGLDRLPEATQIVAACAGRSA
ncbi:MAG: hypothetical protein NW206_19695 [Hyphomonadaceae bacterium]|nr:hypothetical protein [Hyphomonadaceae bacterium]